MRKPTKLQPPLKAKAKDSARVVIKDSLGEQEIKSGAPLDMAAKIEPASTLPSIGLSKGATLNMGDYQSARVDAWITDVLKDGEEARDGFRRLDKLLDEVLNEITDSILGGE